MEGSQFSQSEENQASQPKQNWQVNLAVFEGPLDLLLHLIQELEIDIYDIPIAQITQQYLSYIHSSNVMVLDQGGDYLVMAATLMAIKSQMLLPRNDQVQANSAEEDDQGQDPRNYLMALLIQYRRFTEISKYLSGREDQRLTYISKPKEDLSDLESDPTLKPGQVSVSDLQAAFNRVLNDYALRQPQASQVKASRVSVSDKMEEMVADLRDHPGPVSFNRLFDHQSRYELVTAFLALLELTKLNRVKLSQDHLDDEIIINWNGED